MTLKGKAPRAPSEPIDRKVWIRPNAAEGLARVFDGDTGERRRDEDQAA